MSHIVVALMALVIYGATALVVGHTQTVNSYFDHLAAAMLQGRLDVGDQIGKHDLSEFRGKWYVPFPPLPAMLMMPWVAMAGVARTNTVLVGLLIGAANVALMWRMLALLAERGVGAVSARVRGWLTVLFALGSVHWYMAVEGSVWYLGQNSALLFALLAACAVLARAPAWRVGLWLAIAMWGRPNLILIWPVLAGVALMDRRRADESPDWVALRSWIFRASWPIGLTIVGLMAHNYARFNNPLEFGYSIQNVDPGLAGPLFTEGQFSLAHVPRNAYYLFVACFEKPHGNSIWVPSAHGTSVLITMPAVLGLFGLLRTPRRQAAATTDSVSPRFPESASVRAERDFLLAAGLAVVLSLGPILLYYNTGWQQFGYRFLLDLFVPLYVLLSASAARGFGWLWRMLIVASVVANGYGVAWWYLPGLNKPAYDPHAEFACARGGCRSASRDATCLGDPFTTLGPRDGSPVQADFYVNSSRLSRSAARAEPRE